MSREGEAGTIGLMADVSLPRFDVKSSKVGEGGAEFSVLFHGLFDQWHTAMMPHCCRL